MKKILLLILAVALVTTAFAANTSTKINVSKKVPVTKKVTKKENFTLLISGGVNYIANHSIGLKPNTNVTTFKNDTNYGYQVGADLFYNIVPGTGLGLGSYYASAQYRVTRNLISKFGGFTSVPVYVVFRQNLFTSNIISPFISLRAGYAFNRFAGNLSKKVDGITAKALNGQYAGLGLGVLIDNHLNLEALYTYQVLPIKISYNNTSDITQTNVSKVGITLGYEF